MEATGISRKTDAVVEEVLKMIEGAEHVALDIETTGLDPHEHALRLLQISTGQETYVTQVAPYPGKQYPPDPKAAQPSRIGRTRWTIP